MKTGFPKQLSVLCNFPYSVAWLQWPPSEASSLPKDLFIFIHVYVCMSMCLSAHICVNPHKGQKRVSEPLKLEVQLSKVDAGNWSLDPVIGSYSSYLLSHLSTPPPPKLMFFVKE